MAHGNNVVPGATRLPVWSPAERVCVWEGDVRSLTDRAPLTDSGGGREVVYQRFSGEDVTHVYINTTLPVHMTREGGYGRAFVVDDSTDFESLSLAELASLVGAESSLPELCLLVKFAPGGQVAVAAFGLQAVGVVRLDTHLVPHGQDQSRAFDLVEMSSLSKKRVVIVGLGSGGSTIAVNLSMAGIGSFDLFDPDRITLANLPRHACGASDLMRPKVRATREYMLDKNPAATVDTHEIDVESFPDVLEDSIRSADLVIAATDNNSSRRLINKLCLQHEKVCLYGRAMARACGGDVLRVRPGEGACYECVLSAVWAKRSEEISSVDQRGAPDYGFAIDQAVPGLATDIFPIANMIVRLALVELQRGSGSAVALLEQDLTENFYFWANRREDEYEGWSPMGARLDGAAILRWYGANIPTDLHCPVCGDGGLGERPTEEEISFFLEGSSSSDPS